jgi:hypothetical protein
MRGLADFRSSILHKVSHLVNLGDFVCAHKVVLMLSNGVTASNDSVIPAPKPAITVLGPDMLPVSSCNIALYWSKATNPALPQPLSS